MFKKVFHSPSQTITGAALIISVAGLLSRAAGILRDHIFAHYYSTGPVIDAYFAAFKIPDLIYNLLVVGALTAGFIPTFTKLWTKDNGDKAAWKLANNVLNLIAAAMLILAIGGMIGAPLVARLIAPGFTGQRLELVISFTRIIFLSPLLLSISMVMGGILQSLRRFVLYSLAPIFYNLGIILGATVFVPLLGVNGLAYGVVFGALLHAGLQIYGAYQAGFRWQPIANWRDRDTRRVGALMIPRTIGLAITQFNIVAITMLASLLPTGSVAVFNYANNLQTVPLGLIGIPFALAVFPILSGAVANHDLSLFRERFMSTLRYIIFLIVPCSLAMLLLRAQIVRVILGSGQFDWAATIATADTLAFFALSLFAQALIPLLARGFYAFSDTTTPLAIAIASEVVTIIIALALHNSLGVPGLALATSIGAVINLFGLYFYLRKKIKPLPEEALVQMIFRVALAGLAMGFTIQLVKYPLGTSLNLDYFSGILLQGLISGTLGILVYLGICYVLNVQEMLDLAKTFKTRWLKLRNLPANITETNQP